MASNRRVAALGCAAPDSPLAAKASFGVKGLFRILGQVCAILAITLALDYILLATVFSAWRRAGAAYSTDAAGR